MFNAIKLGMITVLTTVVVAPAAHQHQLPAALDLLVF